MWIVPTSDAEVCKGLGAKFKELNCGEGIRGDIVVHFSGLSKTELKRPFLVVEVPGLSVGQDMFADPSAIGYVLFTQKGATDDDSGITITEQVSEWWHNKAQDFINKLRKSDPNGFELSEDCDVGEAFQAVLKIDSEITYLNHLKRPEVAAKLKRLRILMQKVAAAATESFQACDLQQGFKTMKHFIGLLTNHYNETPLKKVFVGLIDQLRAEDILVFDNKTRSDAVIDTVSILPEVYQKAYTKNGISDGYVMSGEISKSKDGKTYHSCPDAHAMMKQCKKTWTAERRTCFQDEMVGCIKEMLAYAKISEEYFDNHDFPLDTTTRGEPVPRKFTDAQYYLMRMMLPHHDEICQRRNDSINEGQGEDP